MYVTVSDICPLTLLITCHLLVETRIAVLSFKQCVFWTCLLFSSCVCVYVCVCLNDRVPGLLCAGGVAKELSPW